MTRKEVVAMLAGIKSKITDEQDKAWDNNKTNGNMTHFGTPNPALMIDLAYDNCIEIIQDAINSVKGG